MQFAPSLVLRTEAGPRAWIELFPYIAGFRYTGNVRLHLLRRSDRAAEVKIVAARAEHGTTFGAPHVFKHGNEARTIAKTVPRIPTLGQRRAKGQFRNEIVRGLCAENVFREGYFCPRWPVSQLNEGDFIAEGPRQAT